MLSYEESLKILKETKALIEGHFILSSGLRSKQYIQCAKLLSYPEKAQIICSSICDKIKKTFDKIDIILSPALGGVIVGYEIGRQLNIETIFAERVSAKLLLRRGFEIKKNSNVLIVEDVITTGKSALECLDLVKLNKSNLVGYACIIDRTNDKSLVKEKIVSQMKFNIETFTKENLPIELKKKIPIKPGSRNISNE
jgi:orotate phosphoribosyltransferase